MNYLSIKLGLKLRSNFHLKSNSLNFFLQKEYERKCNVKHCS